MQSVSVLGKSSEREIQSVTGYHAKEVGLEVFWDLFPTMLNLKHSATPSFNYAHSHWNSPRALATGHPGAK